MSFSNVVCYACLVSLDSCGTKCSSERVCSHYRRQPNSNFHYPRKDSKTITCRWIDSVRRFQFDFIQYLRAVYALSNVTLQDNDVVSVREIAFLRNASELLRRTPSRTIQNYFVWRFMMSRASIMPRNFRNIRDRFDRVFRGTSAERPRSIICSNYVNNNMGFAVAKVFIKKYFDENAKSQVRNRKQGSTELGNAAWGSCPLDRHDESLFDLVIGNDWEYSESVYWNDQKLVVDGWRFEDKSGRKSKPHACVL